MTYKCAVTGGSHHAAVRDALLGVRKGNVYCIRCRLTLKMGKEGEWVVESRFPPEKAPEGEE